MITPPTVTTPRPSTGVRRVAADAHVPAYLEHRARGRLALALAAAARARGLTITADPLIRREPGRRPGFITLTGSVPALTEHPCA